MRAIAILLVGLTACATEPDVCGQVQENFNQCGIEIELDCSAASEAELQQVAALECDGLEGLVGTTPALTGKADMPIKSAPANWHGYAETSRSSVDWIYTWTTHAGWFLDNLAESFHPFGTVLPDAKIQEIAAQVRGMGDCSTMVANAGKQVEAAIRPLNGGYVCRNYAADLKRVLRVLGLPANFEGGTTLEGYAPIGHAWIESSCDGHRIIADAYNSIYVSVD
jgi:hypothetical protein